MTQPRAIDIRARGTRIEPGVTRDEILTNAVEARLSGAILYRRRSSSRKLHDRARNGVAKRIILDARSRRNEPISTEHPMLLLLQGNQVVYAAIGRLPVREARALVERALRDQPVRTLKCG